MEVGKCCINEAAQGRGKHGAQVRQRVRRVSIKTSCPMGTIPHPYCARTRSSIPFRLVRVKTLLFFPGRKLWRGWANEEICLARASRSRRRHTC